MAQAARPRRTGRRRRTPREAEREILDAAESLLRADPASELTITSVMERTTLTRNSFYVHFRDRFDLIARLVGRLREDADRTMDAFADRRNEARAAGRDALAAAARLYRDHGELLRALAIAAQSDPNAARAWSEFVAPSQEVVTARIEEEVQAGRVVGIDPEPTVRALISMNRACFFEQLVGRPGADVDALVATLQSIWERTLFDASS